MIDAERMSTSTYRVSVNAPPMPPTPYFVTTYPEANNGEPPITNGYYAWEALPAWMQLAIQLLDIAGGPTYIPNVGEKRKSGTYWFWRTDNPAMTDANQFLLYPGD